MPSRIARRNPAEHTAETYAHTILGAAAKLLTQGNRELPNAYDFAHLRSRVTALVSRIESVSELYHIGKAAEEAERAHAQLTTPAVRVAMRGSLLISSGIDLVLGALQLGYLDDVHPAGFTSRRQRDGGVGCDVCGGGGKIDAGTRRERTCVACPTGRALARAAGECLECDGSGTVDVGDDHSPRPCTSCEAGRQRDLRNRGLDRR